MTPQPSRPVRLPLAALLLVCLSLYLFPIWWGLPATGSQSRTWAFDEVRPTPGETVQQRHGGRYPPFHYAVLRSAHAPVQWLQASGRLDLEPRQAMTVLQLVSRGVSLLMALGIVLLVYRTARLLLERAWSWFAAATASFAPPLTFYAKTANLEVPYLFWFALSLFFYLRALQRHRPRHYLAFAAAATLAICTKDQAYGLYLLPSVALAWRLRRHAYPGSPTLRGFVRVLADRRVVLSLLLATALFGWVHGLPSGVADFLYHLRVITGPASEPYQAWNSSFGGQAAMAVQAVRHVAFSMGTPLFLLALLGIGVAFARRRLRSRWLPLLLFPLSYYACFIAVILYHYVRFFLPVGLVLSLFAALGGKALWERAHRPAIWLGPALAGALGYTLLVGLSLDLHMHFDSRYLVERWMAEQRQAGKRVLVIGNARQRLPRSEVVVPIDRVRRHPRRLLPAADPVYLVLNEAEFSQPGDQVLLEQLRSGELNFQLERRFHRRPPVDLLDLDGLVTTLRYVNPEITILRRIGPWGMSGVELTAALKSLLASPDETRWEELIDRIESSRRLEPIELRPGIRAYGLRANGRMHSGDRVALLVSNRRYVEATFSLLFACTTTESECVEHVRLIGPDRRTEVALEQGEALRVVAATLAPEAKTLVALEASGGAERRGRSVRIRGFRLRPIVEKGGR